MVKTERTIKADAWLPAGTERRTVFLMFGLSLILHVSVLALFIWRPASGEFRRLPGPVVNVRLVSLPGPPAVASTAASKAPVAKAVSSQKAVSIKKTAKKKFQKKISLKKQTYKPEKIVADAIREIEKQVETRESETDPIDEAIERLKGQVGKREAASPTSSAPTDAPARAGGGGGGGGPIGLLDIYRAEVAVQVNKNWAFSETLAGASGRLTTAIVFRVFPDGEIRDIRFTQKSGNRFLDEAAYNAIVKSSPVRAHPPGISQPYIEVGLRFTPEGIR